MASVAEEKKTTVFPFAIEFDSCSNSDYKLNSLPEYKFRSALKTHRTVMDNETGEEAVPVDMIQGLSMLPTIPGMQLHVNPTDRTFEIIDPLCDRQDLTDRIAKVINSQGAIRADKGVRGVPTVKGNLDVHRMKTLCREMVMLLDAGEAELVKGVKPSLQAISKLPGKFLLNPGSQIQNNLPRYEEDYDVWLENLKKHGG